MDGLSQVGMAIGGTILSFLSGWILYLKKRDKEKLDGLDTRVTSLENVIVTEQRVREVIREELKSTHDDFVEVKGSLSAMQLTLLNIQQQAAQDRGYRMALEKYGINVQHGNASNNSERDPANR